MITAADREKHRVLSRAWTRFDRLTAYGCRQRGEPFDRDAMQTAWDAYQATIDSYYVGTASA